MIPDERPTQLKVTNIAMRASIKTVQDLFSQYGKNNITMPLTGGEAIVEMLNYAEAEAALMLDGYTLCGQIIRVRILREVSSSPYSTDTYVTDANTAEYFDDHMAEQVDNPYDKNYNASRASLGFAYEAAKYEQFQADCISNGSTCARCGGVITYATKADYANAKALKKKGIHTDRRLWFTVDHITPVADFIAKHHSYSDTDAQTWYNNVSNWQAMHWGCNAKKGSGK